MHIEIQYLNDVVNRGIKVFNFKEVFNNFKYKKEFKSTFGFELKEVLVNIGRNKYVLNSEKFLQKAFNHEIAKYKPDTIVNLVKEQYGENACLLIRQILLEYK